jgi:hypothetical protein
MVSFKGSFVFCLFYRDSFGVVQWSFCCLFVLPWWLRCRSRELLLFACFIFIIMVSFKGSFMFACFIFIVMVSFKGSFVFCLFYRDSFGVVQWSFCCLFVLPWWLRCRSRELLLFVCFTFIVMVSFKGSLFFACFILIVMVSFKGAFVVCLFCLYGYGVVQGIFCCLFVLAW